MQKRKTKKIKKYKVKKKTKKEKNRIVQCLRYYLIVSTLYRWHFSVFLFFFFILLIPYIYFYDLNSFCSIMKYNPWNKWRKNTIFCYFFFSLFRVSLSICISFVKYMNCVVKLNAPFFFLFSWLSNDRGNKIKRIE